MPDRSCANAIVALLQGNPSLLQLLDNATWIGNLCQNDRPFPQSHTLANTEEKGDRSSQQPTCFEVEIGWQFSLLPDQSSPRIDWAD